MSYKTISRADAYEIGFGTEAPASLTNPKRLVNYTDLTELQCTIKSDGYIHSLAEYSTPNPDGKYRAVLSDDIVAAGYVLTYVMNGHGEQIEPERVNSIPNPLPTPTADDWMFSGWFLNSELTAKATPGTKLTQDTTIYAKWVETTLRFGIQDSVSSELIDVLESVSSITLNDTIYVGDSLAEHYDSTTKILTFTGFTEANIVYSIINKESSNYRDIVDAQQTFESLNNKNVIIYRKTSSFGDITVTCNWLTGETSNNIFDMYTLIYQGQAPSAGETGSTSGTKIMELSYGTSDKNFYLPESAATVYYDTNSASWVRGETTTVTMKSGITLEDILRTYSFVFLINDYTNANIGESDKTTSTFGKNAPNMTITIKIGNYQTRIISLNEISGTTQETTPEFANWIIFKTRILGRDEDIAQDLSNVIVEFNRGGYSYFDGTNEQKTYTYSITQTGGGGYINN